MRIAALMLATAPSSRTMARGGTNAQRTAVGLSVESAMLLISYLIGFLLNDQLIACKISNKKSQRPTQNKGWGRGDGSPPCKFWGSGRFGKPPKPLKKIVWRTEYTSRNYRLPNHGIWGSDQPSAEHAGGGDGGTKTYETMGAFIHRFVI